MARIVKMITMTEEKSKMEKTAANSFFAVPPLSDTGISISIVGISV